MLNGDVHREENRWYFKVAAKRFLVLLLTCATLFVAAGRMNYWQGWVFCIVNLIFISIAFALFFKNKELLKERLKPGPGVKWWDKVFYAFCIPIYVLIYVVPSMDAGRFHWTTGLPLPVYIVGYIVLVFSYVLALWAMWTNRFFSSMVRIQTDRGHEVVQGGPYGVVRHPGYVSALLSAGVSPLVLGSVYGLIPVGFVVLLFVLRTYLEDATLQKELPGYVDYAKNVRYRLLPGVW